MKAGLSIVAFVAAAAAMATAAPPQLQLGQELLPPDSGRLPAAGDSAGMTLRMKAVFDCATPEAEARLFVSVANIAVTANAAKSPQPVVLKLPAGQLRGVQESLACPGLGPHLLRAQLTAYATLICRAADGTESAATVNQPVDLWVECVEPPEPPVEEAAEEPGAEDD